MGQIWRLFAGDEHVADLIVTGSDFPWLEADVEAAEGFERYRPLFEAELKANDEAAETDDWDAADRAHEDIRKSLRMAYPDGGDVPEFLLHIDGSRAWWRWHDEPFES